MEAQAVVSSGSERPAGAKAAVTQGLLQMAGGDG